MSRAEPVEQECPQILVVDDETDMCWALENILRPAGYAVTTTVNGAEALALIRRDRYAAAFIDAKLPDLDGLELAATIRQHSPHTFVVLISGYYYREDQIICEAMEEELFAGFIAKPFDLEQVRLMADRAVEQARKEGDTCDEHPVSR